MSHFCRIVTVASAAIIATHLAAQPAHASEPVSLNWVAIQAGQQVMTAHEVREYIDAVVLSSDLHQELFRAASGDFSRYLEQKNALVEDLFEDTLERVALIQVVQQRLTQGPERRFFTLTRTQMQRALENRVATALAPFRKKGLALAEARLALASELVAQGFPHSSAEGLEGVYAAWLRRMQVRMREEYRQNEVARYLCGIGDCLLSSPSEIFTRHRARFEKGALLVLRPSAERELRLEKAFDRITSVDSALSAPLSRTSSSVERGTDLYLGRIVEERIELLHVNDWNLLGSLGTAAGFPKTDDQGRTSAVLHTRTRTGTEGDLTVQIENWLFTEKLAKTPAGILQQVEEENTLRIASRQFLDHEGNRWLVVGVAGTSRSQREGVGSWLQEQFHKLNSSNNPRVNIPRDGAESFLQGLIGLGSKYSIIETPHVDLILSGQGLLAPTFGELSQNSVNVRSALDLNVYGRTRKIPVLRIGLFSELRIRADGSTETVLGGRATLVTMIRRIQFETGLYVIRWDGELDRRYEGGASWTTGLMLAMTRAPSRVEPDYEF
jgi:hypothetical protein